MTKVLVVEDDRSLSRLIQTRLEMQGYQVSTALNAEEALGQFRKEMFDMALVDLRLDGYSGIELMGDFHRVGSAMPILILTAYGTIKSAVEAMEKGACGYITKPFEFGDLIVQIDKCLQKRQRAGKAKASDGLIPQVPDIQQIVCKSEKMKKVLRKAARAARAESTVLIHGESGTGKELIASYLHQGGSRKKGPFVALNCAAIPETLLESELFGHEKGAFTGADSKKAGHLVQAGGGTLFLDEIAEISLNMQVKLLRVLEEKAVYPLGSNNAVPFDARILTATNKKLKDEIKSGNFREDLFFRIHVIVIELPPLRERKEDLLDLAGHFLKIHASQMQKGIHGFSERALQKMLHYEWPGNVRELKNSIESAVAFCDQDRITDDLILPAKEISVKGIPSLKDAKKSFEKKYLVKLIGSTRGNVSQAAKLAGKYRADLYELLKKYRLDPDDFRDK